MRLPSLKILLLEDSPSDVLLLQNALEADQFSTFSLTHVERLADGLKRLQEEPFDAILTDLGLPDSMGLATFERLHQQFPNLPIIVFSGNVDASEAIRAVRSGAQDYLVKDLSGFEMAARSIRYAIERHIQKQALLESENRYRQTLDNMMEGCQIIGYDWRYLYLNDAAVLQAHQSASELIGHTMMEMYPGIELTPFFIRLQECMSGRTTKHFDTRFSYPDGTQAWFELSVQPVEQGLFILSTDITARKLAEEQLRQSEENYRLLSEELESHVQQRTAEVQDLYDSAPIGYHSLDRDGQFIKINQTELHWLGYTRAEIMGHPFSNFITAASRKTFQENFLLFKVRGWVNNLEFEMCRKDGTTFPVLVNSVAVKDEEGNYLMSRSILFDNTERKNAEIALLQSRDQLTTAYAALEKASRAKDEFLANMSHELRTPLNGILGVSEILLEEFRGPLNEHQQNLVHTIENSGRHLLSLINDILDLSKIEAGQLEIHPKQILLQNICLDSLAFVKEPAARKRITVDFLPDPAATTVFADERSLKQILVNLLNNAVKFTPVSGKVELAVHANRDESTIDLSVSDTGIGISTMDLQRLFQPFTQVDSSLTRQHEGTGLGLALVKRLTELHGGGIHVTSEVGQGSCFTVSLPWQQESLVQETLPKTESEPVGQSSPSAGLAVPETILLAEDTETNIMTIGDYLESLGYRLIYARTGREALSMAAEFLPDVILMDIQLPELNGLESISRLRADARFVFTPIVAVTALVMPGDRERCLEAGATAYLSKPIRLKQLASLIRDLLDHT